MNGQSCDNLPFVSVVIPLFNGAPYISRAVRSVLAQTYDNFELIVVDDGSTDGGGSTVLEFTDQRLRLIRQENAGVSAARNRGISEARGKYIALLDADDQWDEGFLQAVVALSIKYPHAGIFTTGFRMAFPRGYDVEVTVREAIYKETSLLITDYFYRADGWDFIHTSGIMIPRSVFDRLGNFLIGEHHGQDIEMWSRISLRYAIAYDTRILFTFYQTGKDSKPRFKNFAKHDPKVLMLQETLAESEGLLVDHETIRSHIKNFLAKRCLLFSLTNTHTDTLEYMKNNNTAMWLPLLSRFVQNKQAWLLLKGLAWIHKVAYSRIAMRILGGQRITHGIMIRLREKGSDSIC